MKNNLFHSNFIDEISKKVPQRNKMVALLTDLLDLEKEAVYRRLRGEVPFTFREVALISRRFTISIDEVVDTSNDAVSPFKMRMMEFNEPHDADLFVMKQLVEFIYFINNPETEYAESTNILPKGWAFRHDSLIRFYLFKWLYQYDESFKVKSYKDIRISDKMSRYYKLYVRSAHRTASTRYVLDFRLFEYLINDLLYFHGIRLIDEDELRTIQADLIETLDYVERLCISGKYEDTGNKLQVYVSNLNFESNYSCLRTSSYHVSFLKTFILNGVVSFDRKTFDKIGGWIQAQIKSSTLITESGEMERISFFQRQRKLVESIIEPVLTETIAG